MNNSEVTKEILNKYYEGFSTKGDWHSMLAEDILLTGTIAKESQGRELFVNNNFFKMVTGLKVKDMIVEDRRCLCSSKL